MEATCCPWDVLITLKTCHSGKVINSNQAAAGLHPGWYGSQLLTITFTPAGGLRVNDEPNSPLQFFGR